MSVIAFLNAVIDAKPLPVVTEDEARAALYTLELFPLACGAVRTLIEHPADVEAVKHANRCLAHFDATAKKVAALPATRLTPTRPTVPAGAAASSDLSDLG